MTNKTTAAVKDKVRISCNRYYNNTYHQLNRLYGSYGENIRWNGLPPQRPSFALWLSDFYRSFRRNSYLIDSNIRLSLQSSDFDKLSEKGFFDKYKFGKVKAGEARHPGVFLHNLSALNRFLYLQAKKESAEINEIQDFTMALDRFREKNNSKNLISEQTPLGWYIPTSPFTNCTDERIGHSQESADGESVHRYRVTRPAPEGTEGLMSDEPRRLSQMLSDGEPFNYLLPFVESKLGERYPFSTQIKHTLENIKSLLEFMDTFPVYREKASFIELKQRVEGAYPYLYRYLKGLVTREMQAIVLHDFSQEARQHRAGANYGAIPVGVDVDENQMALDELATLLQDPDTIAILTKNTQSESEYYFKLISVLTIFIGVGIIPTAGLAYKRYCDTGGHSINFFKPLSQDLLDNMNSIRASVNKASF